MNILKRHRDLFIGIGMLCISVLYYISSFNIKSRNLIVAYGPEIMPRIYGAALGTLSIVLIITEVIKMRRETKSREEYSSTITTLDTKKFLGRTVGTIALVGIYVFTLKPVGFLVSSAIYIMLQLILISPPAKTKYIKYAVTSVVAAVTLDYLFVSFFNLGLPHGILGF